MYSLTDSKPFLRAKRMTRKRGSYLELMHGWHIISGKLGISFDL